MNRGFLYGDGFFETLAWINETCFLLPYHLKRAQGTAHYLEMRWPEQWDLSFFHEELRRYSLKHKLDDVVIRISFFRSGNGSYLPVENNIEFHISSRPINSKLNSLPITFEDLLQQLQNNICYSAFIYSDLLKPLHALSNYKLLSSIFYVKAGLALNSSKANTLVILNEECKICEGLDSNIFIIRNNRIITPKLDQGCVAGTARAYLIDTLDITEQVLTEEDLKSADVVFMANAVKGVYPVKLI